MLHGWFMAPSPGMNHAPGLLTPKLIDGEIIQTFLGWPVSELAEISIMVGEGTWLHEPLKALEEIPKEFRP